MKSTWDVFRLPEARFLITEALKEETLKRCKATQLRAYATVLSTQRSRVTLDESQIRLLGEELSKTNHLEMFNPIDLTNIYASLIRIGFQYEKQ